MQQLNSLSSLSLGQPQRDQAILTTSQTTEVDDREEIEEQKEAEADLAEATITNLLARFVERLDILLITAILGIIKIMWEYT